jgi:hypothetical protein
MAENEDSQANNELKQPVWRHHNREFETACLCVLRKRILERFNKTRLQSTQMHLVPAITLHQSLDNFVVQIAW